MELSQSQRSMAWVGGVTLSLVTTILLLVLVVDESGGGALGTIKSQPPAVLRGEVIGSDGPDDLPIEQFLPRALLNLSPQDAMARNLALPISRGPNPVAPAFVAQWLNVDLEAETKCLAAAVYYEAAGEPMVGQRAVAQVVLNRLRNPRYPKTICGVVYQGSDRPTGCQFSFTCDGSLRRQPSVASWARAVSVANSVLNGASSAEVGQATHYHTLAVFPAWAPELAKIGIIGHHVFYRPPGHAIYGYELIAKAAKIDAPLLDPALKVLAADPSPAISLPDITNSPVAALVASPTVRAEYATTSRRDVGVGEPDRLSANQGMPPETTTEVPRSMFPTRRSRAPNLPLASDH